MCVCVCVWWCVVLPERITVHSAHVMLCEDSVIEGKPKKWRQVRGLGPMNLRRHRQRLVRPLFQGGHYDLSMALTIPTNQLHLKEMKAAALRCAWQDLDGQQSRGGLHHAALRLPWNPYVSAYRHFRSSPVRASRRR